MSRLESPDRTTTVSAQLNEKRSKALDKYCEENDISKSEVIRNGIDRLIQEPEKVGNRVPPDNEDLAKAWKELLRITDGGGKWLRKENACILLAQHIPAYNKQTAYYLLRRLDKRGYINITGDIEGRNTSVFVFE